MEPDWENLPKHLLDSVVEKLPTPSDYLGFSLVCKSWYSIAKDNSTKHAGMTAPMLMFYSGKKDYWNFYDLINQKVLNFQVNVTKKRIVGSSKGWLIFVEKNIVDKIFGVTLVKPLFRIRGRRENKENSIIRLPPLTPLGWKKWYKNSQQFVRKATISADPILDANNCIVTVIYLDELNIAFIRSGKDTTWTYVDESVDNAFLGFQLIEEVINIGDKFYAVSSYRDVFSFDATAPSNSKSGTKLVVRGCDPDENYIKRYIFEGEKNKLWMVQRYLNFKGKRVTTKFRVFELDFQSAEWIEKNTLNGAALFVGDNSSVRVLAPELSGFESNCIYYNHDFDYIDPDYDACDFGAYNVEDQCFQNIYSESAKKLLEMSHLLPIWVVPTLSLKLQNVD